MYLFQLSRQDFRAELAQDLNSAAMRAGDLWAQRASASELTFGTKLLASSAAHKLVWPLFFFS